MEFDKSIVYNVQVLSVQKFSDKPIIQFVFYSIEDSSKIGQKLKKAFRREKPLKNPNHQKVLMLPPMASRRRTLNWLCNRLVARDQRRFRL